MSLLDTKIYILAAGKQSRFPNTYKPKQLLTINNETILERQIKQCSEYQIVPTVITHNPLIQNNSPKFIHPDNNTTILHSIQSSLPWEEHTIFLHPSILEAGHPNLTLLEAMACGLTCCGDI